MTIYNRATAGVHYSRLVAEYGIDQRP